MAGDLHAGFRDPSRIPADDLARFLEQADRLPGIRAVQRAMRQANLERVLDDLVDLLAPGGRLALFELDYGATILAPGAADGAVLRRVLEALHASLPQPLAGSRIPGLLAERGLRDVVASPFSFSVDEPIWRRIVVDTLTADPALDPGVADWLRSQSEAAARGEFVAAFTGVLTAATRPSQLAP
jgi:hypothetical protein